MADPSGTQAFAERGPPPDHGDRAIVVERFIDAPRDLVWKAWIEPDHLMRWWGPRGFTSPSARTDPRVGGTYLWGMRSPDGQDFFTTGVFREVAEPERFVLTESFAKADGTVIPASEFGLPGDWPAAVVMTVTLDERDGGTAMTVREEGVPAEQRGPAEAGLRESIDKLAEYLETADVPGGSRPDPRRRPA